MMKIFKQPSILINGMVAYDYYYDIKGRFSDYGKNLGDIKTGIPASFVSKEFGGSGANIAYAAKKSGAEVMLLSYVGRDFMDYKRHFEKNRISYFMCESKRYDCSHCAIYSDDSRNAISFFENGALEEKAAMDFEAVVDRIDCAKLKLAVIAPDLAKKSLAFYRFVRKEKIGYLFDPGAKVMDFTAAEFLKLAGGSFATILNQKELELVNAKIGGDIRGDARIKNLIVTLGKDGVETFCSGKMSLHKDAVRQKSAVNTVGCGDALRGGLLSCLAEDCNLENALQHGIGLAARQAGRSGTQNFLS